MKKLLIILLFIWINSYSQYNFNEYTKAVTFGVDTKMLLMGPYPNRNPNPDRKSEIHAFAQLILPNNEYTEAGLLINYTNGLDTWTNYNGQELSSYLNWGIFFNVKFLQLGTKYAGYQKHTIYWGIELTQLIRPKLYYSMGSNLGYRYMFNEHIGLDAKINFMTRPDLNNATNSNSTRFNGVLSAIYYFDLYK